MYIEAKGRRERQQETPISTVTDNPWATLRRRLAGLPIDAWPVAGVPIDAPPAGRLTDNAQSSARLPIDVRQGAGVPIYARQLGGLPSTCGRSTASPSTRGWSPGSPSTRRRPAGSPTTRGQALGSPSMRGRAPGSLSTRSGLPASLCAASHRGPFDVPPAARHPGASFPSAATTAASCRPRLRPRIYRRRHPSAFVPNSATTAFSVVTATSSQLCLHGWRPSEFAACSVGSAVAILFASETTAAVAVESAAR
uniref:Uncharacterized protein n=1 Tax=Oryza rufipogon TaxID=4529 RepID=A0A0E0NET9_ORYRU